MDNYEHTQIGYLILFVILAIVLLFGIVLARAGFDYLVLAVMAFVLFILSSFLSLTTRIDKDNLHVKFGYGLFKRCFALRDIASARTVKNHWYNGWGIRVWFWPYMWIYNVSGFDAVEIKMKNGKLFRIGTDEPKELEHAIIQSIK